MRRFVSFLGVGLAGFAIDAGLTSLFAFGGAGPLAARLPAVAFAVILTFLLNRRFAFAPGAGGIAAEFLRYVAVSAAGTALNVTVYAICFSALAGVEAAGVEAWRAFYPALAVAAGSGAAMLLTYAGYRGFVFGAAKSPTKG